MSMDRNFYSTRPIAEIQMHNFENAFSESDQKRSDSLAEYSKENGPSASHAVGGVPSFSVPRSIVVNDGFAPVYEHRKLKGNCAW
jgi:hypothetical protein